MGLLITALLVAFASASDASSISPTCTDGLYFATTDENSWSSGLFYTYVGTGYSVNDVAVGAKA